MASQLKVDQIQNTSGESAINIDAQGAVTFPNGGGGKLLNTYFVHYDEINTLATTTPIILDAFTQTITPTSASSKFLIQLNMMSTSSTGQYTQLIELLRDDTPLGNPPTGTNAYWYNEYHQGLAINSAKMFLDTPNTTNQITYKIRVRSDSQTVYINRHQGSADYTGTSQMVIMEIGA
jgi:hypothetical protein